MTESGCCVELMNEVPEWREIMTTMKEMRESTPGEDGVMIGYIRKAREAVKTGVVEIVQKMFQCGADRSEKSVKVHL